MNWIARLGARQLASARMIAEVIAIGASAVWQGCRPRTWPRTTRNVLARQLLFTGVEALRFIAFAAVLTGVTLVLQVHMWLTRVGQTELVGPVLSTLLIRELGPLLVNVVVIGRSGTAMTTELANMRVHGEFDVLQRQGIDPFLYLVIPRVLATSLAVAGLAAVFVALSLVTGTLVGILIGALPSSAHAFVVDVLGGASLVDLLNFLVKTLVTGGLIASICVYEAGAIRGVLTEVPQAGTRAVTRAIEAVLIVTALMTVLTYL